jgi:hypothetical protein
MIDEEIIVVVCLETQVVLTLKRDNEREREESTIKFNEIVDYDIDHIRVVAVVVAMILRAEDECYAIITL